MTGLPDELLAAMDALGAALSAVLPFPGVQGVDGSLGQEMSDGQLSAPSIRASASSLRQRDGAA